MTGAKKQFDNLTEWDSELHVEFGDNAKHAIKRGWNSGTSTSIKRQDKIERRVMCAKTQAKFSLSLYDGEERVLCSIRGWEGTNETRGIYSFEGHVIRVRESNMYKRASIFEQWEEEKQ